MIPGQPLQPLPQNPRSNQQRPRSSEDAIQEAQLLLGLLEQRQQEVPGTENEMNSELMAVRGKTALSKLAMLSGHAGLFYESSVRHAWHRPRRLRLR